MIYDDVVHIHGVVGGRICRRRRRQNVVYLRCTFYVNDVKGGMYNKTTPNKQLQLVDGLLDGLGLVA